jgi:uncharacterized RDD family membrane protein YckC
MDDNLLLDYEEKEIPQYEQLASLWQRFGAYLIDGVILNGAFIIVRKYVSMVFIIDSDMIKMVALYALISFICLIISWSFCTLFESSKYQGTVGKIVFRILITDLNQERISFLIANRRYFVKNLLPQLPSFFLLFQSFWEVYHSQDMLKNTYSLYITYFAFFLMVGVCLVAFFTEKRQALHDIFAKTLVYKKTY